MDSQTAQSNSATRPRLVLLGASNLTRFGPHFLDAARAARGEPLEMLSAQGFGRSLGVHSRVLGRRLPGILQCGIWEALRAHPAEETFALLTDIGNDLLYEIPLHIITRWIEECLDRLAAHRARIVMTRLPVQNLSGLGNTRFLICRTCSHPVCQLTLAEACERAHELDARVQQLAEKYGAALVPSHVEWYGWDPIHVRRRQWKFAWKGILAGWNWSVPENPVKTPWGRKLQFFFAAAERRWLFGRQRHHPQPCLTWPDGSTLSLY